MALVTRHQLPGHAADHDGGVCVGETVRGLQGGVRKMDTQADTDFRLAMTRAMCRRSTLQPDEFAPRKARQTARIMPVALDLMVQRYA
ncbi:MAG: hypothetical protein RLZZ584_1884 [Pseudomonadota bacterium]|jgi:fructose/tagatose bisphosphate aldolase